MDVKTKQKNLDSAILFMQQEHATTLKGLHEEITNLQKRCSELTFQVAMSNTSISQEDEFREKCQQLEKDLSSEGLIVKTLETELEQKDKRINFLEQKVKSQNGKFQDLKDSHKTIVHDLKMQLTAKSDTIAVLNSKYHQQRQQMAHHEKNSDHSNQRESRVGSASSSTEGSPRLLQPAPPPKDGAPRRHRRRSSQDHDPAIPRILNPPLKPVERHRSSRKLPEKPQSPENIPDPTPFLSRDDERLQMPKREKTILPPINRSIMPGVGPVKRMDNVTFLKRGTQNVETVGNSSPEVEVETLAMSPVTQGDHRLRRAQDYNNSD